MECNAIINDDCNNVMDNIPSNFVDLVVTDPPYGIDFQSGWRDKSEQFDKLDNDDCVDTSFLDSLFDVLKENSACYIFTRWDVYGEWVNAVESAGFDVLNCLVWDRGVHGMGDLEASYAPRHDFIIYAGKGRPKLYGKRPVDILKYQRVSPDKLDHPTEKPVGLCRDLIANSSEKEDVVFDPFCGSGSTCVAAKQLDREYVGVEVDDEFAELSRRRLRKQPERLDQFTDSLENSGDSDE